MSTARLYSRESVENVKRQFVTMSTLTHDVADANDVIGNAQCHAETRKRDARKETHHAGHKINV
jgi:hypothetical protein